jgi:hypothetical protein
MFKHLGVTSNIGPSLRIRIVWKVDLFFVIALRGWRIDNLLYARYLTIDSLLQSSNQTANLHPKARVAWLSGCLG